MSYILDALRKADAQRERDSSRGIHAHPTPPGASASNGARAPRLWGAAAVAIGLAGWGVWHFSQDKAVAAAPPVAANPPPATTATPVPATAPVVAESTAPVEPPQVAADVVPPPEPRRPELPLQPPRMGGMARPVPPMSPPQGARVAPVTAPPIAQAAPPTPAVTGLPPDAPRVAISGGVYSPSPAQRMLIVNGQVFNEGSEVAAGLTIEKIEPRNAVLKFRGALYTVAY